ncbi:RNA polymerase sigma factor [Aquimarina sp. 2201CG14-23]|uniref:RNA polymerase sigma factor n=1 Tax=Aquimarina mycalae TaxID=3040073 RepID=UPI002477EB92|nr:sigma-70 family RNA polymerase sigma factor [Aquimarina sp. 2201CG14-23]MDH7446927.1 sigma-70 family RNA polymerase sigma factor [Aquimarina sp. 2201CG14-23]
MANNTRISEGIIAGDKVILKEFYKRNFKHIQNYIINNSGTKEDTEDIFQDALLIVYAKFKSGSLEMSCSIHAYFYGVCKNLWRSKLRKKHLLIFDNNISNIFPETVDTIINTIETEERENLYHKHFTKLSINNKRLLDLVFEGNNTAEIASKMNYSIGYARKKKSLCKKYLLKKIEKDPKYQELRFSL